VTAGPNGGRGFSLDGRLARTLRQRQPAVSYPHRLGSTEYQGYRLYFLTICTYARARHFTSDAVVERVWLQFLRTATATGFQILAYCFMPDHVHMVAAGLCEGTDLRRFISAAKQSSGFALAPVLRGRLWQLNYYDRTLRKSDDLAAIIAYMLNNPVRAGLVPSPAEYRFWGSQCYTREELLAFVGSAARRP
jgi:putative transposase